MIVFLLLITTVLVLGFMLGMAFGPPVRAEIEVAKMIRGIKDGTIKIEREVA